MGAEAKPAVLHNGWISVGKGGKAAELSLTVRAEPDPRFVFEFDGELYPRLRTPSPCRHARKAQIGRAHV